MSGREIVRGMRDGMPPPKPQRQSNGTFDVLLTIIAVVAIGACAYFAVGWWLGRSGVPPAPGAPKVVAAALGTSTPTAIWTADDDAACKAKARAAVQAADAAEFALANRTVTEGFAGLAASVRCRIATKVLRFCGTEAKAELVALVGDYLNRLDLVLVGLAAQGAPMKAMGDMFGGEMAAGSDVYEMSKDETVAFMETAHGGVRDGLRNLARRGIVAEADFGSFMGMGVPPRIKTMLAGVTATEHACP